MRKLPHVRYITPASVDVGDTIRVTWATGDIERSVVAVVHRVDVEYSGSIFYAPDGQEIFRWAPGLERRYRVTLLNRREAPQTQLPGMVNL